MISSLFAERRKFVIIGLTGRTGSGCTTAATILENEKPDFPNVENVNYESNPFFQGLDYKRYEIVSKYTNENYSSFVSIKVSDLISTYILSMTATSVIEFIHSQTSTISKSKIEILIKKGAFSNSFLQVAKLKNISTKILNHTQNFELTETEKSKFFTFQQEFPTLQREILWEQ